MSKGLGGCALGAADSGGGANAGSSGGSGACDDAGSSGTAVSATGAGVSVWTWTSTEALIVTPDDPVNVPLIGMACSGGHDEMLELDRADKLQNLGLALERSDGDRIAEGIVDPAHLGRRVDHQSLAKKPKIMAVARAEHQPLITERHRLGVFVAGALDDLEGAHQGRTMPKRSRGCTRTDSSCRAARNQAKGKGPGKVPIGTKCVTSPVPVRQ